jgi:predicted PurR-regulated permease PerM
MAWRSLAGRSLMNEPTHPVDSHARTQAAARVLLATVLAAFGLWTIWEFIPAIVWAGIFAIALWPLFVRAERRWPPGKHNVLLPAVFTLGVALLFFVPLALVGVEAAREAHGIRDWVEDARSHGIPPPSILLHLPVGASQATDWWQSNLSDPDSMQDLLQQADRGNLLSSSRRIGAAVLHRLVLFGFCEMTLFFLFRDGRLVLEQILRVSRRTFGPTGERVGRQIVASVHGTVDGLVLVGLGEGLLMGLAYALLGVPHPTLLGMFTAVAAMVPFGAPVAFGLAGLLALMQGSAVSAAIVVGFGVVVTFVADHFIRPVLIGGATRLPFLWVLFGILGGVEAWGLVGLFVGPAIMAALIMLWREWADGPGADASSAGQPKPKQSAS